MKSAAPIIHLIKSQRRRENCFINLSQWIPSLGFNLHPTECAFQSKTASLGGCVPRKWKPNDKHGILTTWLYHSLNKHLPSVPGTVWALGSQPWGVTVPRPLVFIGYTVVGHGYPSDSDKNLAAANLFYLKIWWKSVKWESTRINIFTKFYIKASIIYSIVWDNIYYFASFNEV